MTDGDEAILVDPGYSRYDSQLAHLLATLGLSMDAISAVFVTHHHVDHIGTAELARSNRAQVFAHESDVAKLSGRTKSHPPDGFFRESWRPRRSPKDRPSGGCVSRRASAVTGRGYCLERGNRS